MVQFLRRWLVPLLAGLLLIGIAIAFIPFSRQMETRAETELTLLMDRAFARIEAGESLADPMIKAQEENLLSKAVAVSRFLTHDDTLLASDALAALCEQLSIDQIDVANIEGTLIASSDATRVGIPLGTQEMYAWAMSAADDPTAQLTQQDVNDSTVLFACVGRSDIEGFVLLTRADTNVRDALALSGAESITSDMPYGGDVLFPAAEAGADGFFYESGNLCLRRTQGDVTLIAARPTSEVFAQPAARRFSPLVLRSRIMICGVAAYLLCLEPVCAEDEEPEEEPEALPEEQPDGARTATEAIAELEQPREHKKRARKREQIEEEIQESIDPRLHCSTNNPSSHAQRQVSCKQKTRTRRRAGRVADC
ncbi:MAG: hypothetical protein R2912_04830 [Eubacteriales bacterium]